MAGDAPHDMDGLATVIALQDQHARPLVIGRILFNHYSPSDSSDNIPDQDTIGSQFIIAMLGDHDLSLCD